MSLESIDSLFADEAVGGFGYVIQLSPVCFGAGAAYRRRHPAPAGTAFTSEIGMLRHIDDIARPYALGGDPPLVLFEDGCLAHGASINKAVEDFLREVEASVVRQGGEGGPGLRKGILSRTHVRVHMATDYSLLLSRDVVCRIRADEIVGDAGLRRSLAAQAREAAGDWPWAGGSVPCLRMPQGDLGRLDARCLSPGRWTSLAMGDGAAGDAARCVFRLASARDGVIVTLRAVPWHGDALLVPATHHAAMGWDDARRLEDALLSCLWRHRDDGVTLAATDMLARAWQVPSLAYRVALDDMLVAWVAASAFAHDHALGRDVPNATEVAEFYGLGADGDALGSLACVAFGWDDLAALVEALPGIDWPALGLAAPAGGEHAGPLPCVLSTGYMRALELETRMRAEQRAIAYSNNWRYKLEPVPKGIAYAQGMRAHMALPEFARQCAERQGGGALPVDAMCASLYALIDGGMLRAGYVEEGPDDGRPGASYAPSASGDGHLVVVPVDGAHDAGPKVSQAVAPMMAALSILPRASAPEMWGWFRDTVRHARAHGLGIGETMRRLGYDEAHAEWPVDLLAPVADILEGRRYMDGSVFCCEAAAG